MTGYAQVNGRNAIDWDEKLKLDVWYIDNRSLSVDFGIILKSIAIVLSRKGVASASGTPMPKFTGTVKNPAEPESGVRS